MLPWCLKQHYTASSLSRGGEILYKLVVDVQSLFGKSCCFQAGSWKAGTLREITDQMMTLPKLYPPTPLHRAALIAAMPDLGWMNWPCCSQAVAYVRGKIFENVHLYNFYFPLFSAPNSSESYNNSPNFISEMNWEDSLVLCCPLKLDDWLNKELSVFPPLSEISWRGCQPFLHGVTGKIDILVIKGRDHKTVIFITASEASAVSPSVL